jgi:alpha-tubulin suppressor-like RCC1 family protein
LFIFLGLGTGCKSKPASAGAGPVRDIFAGVSNVFILKEDNTLWGAGYNRFNQLGSGSAAGVTITRINDENGNPFSGIRNIAAGENHTVILKNDGTLWGAGDSQSGELGQQTAQFQTFTQLKTGDTPLSGVKELAAGSNSTMFIQSDGSLWVSGSNYYGELGLKDKNVQSVFIRSESAGMNIKTVSAGLRHTLVLKEDGTLWAAGYNSNGQLGLGDTEDRNSFAEVKGAGSGIIAAAAGNYHSVILKSDGSVWAAGSNFWGQLGLKSNGDKMNFTQVSDEKGNLLSEVREIAARGDITVLVKKDGSLLLAGTYTEPEDGNVPVFVDDGHREDRPGFVSLVPDNSSASKFGTVKKVVLGYSSIYVITDDGRLWVAGSNRYGQLNLDPETVTLSHLTLIDL